MTVSSPEHEHEHLSASQEDYLEAIYQVIREKQAARAKDVALRLSVAAPSVTNALKALKDRGLINHAPYDIITLTSEGTRLAEGVVQRHDVLQRFFSEVLCVESEMAESCACKMEHEVPDTVLERLVAYIRYADRCGHGSATWVEGRGFICQTHAEPRGCVDAHPPCPNKVAAQPRGALADE